MVAISNAIGRADLGVLPCIVPVIQPTPFAPATLPISRGSGSEAARFTPYPALAVRLGLPTATRGWPMARFMAGKVQPDGEPVPDPRTLAPVVGPHAAVVHADAVRSAHLQFDEMLRSAARTIGKELAELPVTQSLPMFWTSLILLDMKVPPAIVEDICLSDVAKTDARTVVDRYQVMLDQPAVAAVVAAVRAMGLSAFFTELEYIHQPDDDVLLARAEAIICAATYFQETICKGLALATDARHTVGLEVEWRPSTATTGLMEMTPISGDVVYEAMAQALRDQGLAITIHRGAGYFSVPSDAHYFKSIVEDIVVDGRHICIERIRGTGAMLLYCYDRDRRKMVLRKAVADNVVDSLDEAYALVAEVASSDLATVKVHAVSGAEGYQLRHGVYLKDRKGNMVMFSVACDETGHATIRGFNTHFRGDDGATVEAVTVAAHNFDEAVQELLRRAHADDTFLVKTETINGIELPPRIEPDGSPTERILRIGWEKSPHRELITWKTILDEAPLIEAVVNVLTEMGLVGTTDEDVIGIHTHGRVPTKVHGAFSIAPVLNILREFVAHRNDFYALLPMHENRLPFIQPLSPEFCALLAKDDYVTDPTDPKQILCVLADVVRLMPEKYVELNMDNILAQLGQEMVQSGQLKPGQRITVRNWHGQTYQFRVTASKKHYTIMVRHNGVNMPVLRIPADSRKPTAELRIPNTLHRHDGEHYRISVDATMWLVNFWAAWSYLHGTLPFAEAGNLE